MNDLQQALVADHIANLEREGTALRAERQRDHLREHAAAGTNATTRGGDLPSRRVRVGRWLVTFGERVAGSSRASAASDRTGRSAFVSHDDPCGDGNDRLAPAA
jgi:hypothetical protein